jgi:hypothetical protein
VDAERALAVDPDNVNALAVTAHTLNLQEDVPLMIERCLAETTGTYQEQHGVETTGARERNRGHICSRTRMSASAGIPAAAKQCRTDGHRKLLTALPKKPRPGGSNRIDEQRSVERHVAGLATRLGDQQAAMTSCAVQ